MGWRRCGKAKTWRNGEGSSRSAGDDDVDGKWDAFGGKQDIGRMNVPDIEAFDAQGERAFVADAAPRQQGEAGSRESSGERLKRGALALKSGLGGDDAPLVRLLLPETDKADVIPKSSFCQRSRWRYSSGVALCMNGSPFSLQLTVYPLAERFVYLIQRPDDSSSVTSCSRPPSRAGARKASGRIFPQAPAHSMRAAHCRSGAEKSPSAP